jgi:hypothetical protein
MLFEIGKRLMVVGLCTLGLQNAFAQDSVETGGDVRAPSPRIMDPNRPGYLNVGVGPALALGLGTDQVLYNVNFGYNRNLSDRFTGKIFTDLNLGTAADSSRLVNFALGTDIYFREVVTGYGVPYAMADVGYGFARNEDDRTEDGIMIGAGAGFKFAAQALNVDVALHYAVLTGEIDGVVPSVLGLRAGLNF